MSWSESRQGTRESITASIAVSNAPTAVKEAVAKALEALPENEGQEFYVNTYGHIEASHSSLTITANTVAKTVIGKVEDAIEHGAEKVAEFVEEHRLDNSVTEAEAPVAQAAAATAEAPTPPVTGEHDDPA